MKEYFVNKLKSPQNRKKKHVKLVRALKHASSATRAKKKVEYDKFACHMNVT